MKATAVSWLVSSTKVTASAGRPTLSSAWRNTATIARFDSMADDEPRRKAALPAFRHRPAASLVTLGRFS
jgi:hypothetical protein